MFDLPILKAEARALARRWPAYRARALLGLMLLIVFWLFHQSHESWSTGRLSSITELAEFGAAAFEWMAVGQALVLLVLVPATVAGAVAEARARQTLPGLLASPLSSVAIIVDQLAAKMLSFGIVLAVGLPLAALLGLLGGIDPRSVIYAYAGTLSTTFFVAALSLLISVYSRRPGSAVLRAYEFEVVWLVAPWIGTFALASRSWLWPLARLNRWIAPTTPLSLVDSGTLSAWSGGGPIRQYLMRFPMRGTWAGPAVLTAPVTWMVGLQLAYGLAFVALAAWRLRPVARRLADSLNPGTLFGRTSARRRPLPACGDDAMFWKELYLGTDRPARSGLWLALAAFSVMTLIYAGPFAYRYPLALDEFFRYGYSTGPSGNDAFMRMAFFRQFTYFSVMFYLVATIAIVVESATGISREREAGTWEGLLATPLEGGEIIRAKMVGAVFRQRALVALVFGPWLVGLVLWALHPLGLLLATAGLFAFLWFATAVGTQFSLWSTTSGPAVVKTLAVLLILNVGTLFAGRLLTGSSEVAALLGNTLLLLSILPVTTHEVSVTFHPAHVWRELLFLGAQLTCVAAYAALAWSRSRGAVREFDAATDRPCARRATRGWSQPLRLPLSRAGGRTRTKPIAHGRKQDHSCTRVLTSQTVALGPRP
jgi:ABC-type transport system involved in multi-copper enzyme maturation permease subunit